MLKRQTETPTALPLDPAGRAPGPPRPAPKAAPPPRQRTEESPTRRAHRLRTRALLTAARPAG